MGVLVRGIGAYVPSKMVTNQQLALTVNTSDEWIVEKTGIHQRRISQPSQATSDLAYEAALNCLNNAGMSVDDIDLIVVATSSPDQIQPAVACKVQEKLGLGHKQIPAFDVNSVCAGFVFALNVGQSMLLANPDQYRHALIVGAEQYSRILNWNDRSTCVYFGDGAGAVLLSLSDKTDRRLEFLLGSDGRGSELIGIPAGGTRQPVDADQIAQGLNKFYMNGRKVWEFATATVTPTIKALLQRHQLTTDDVDLVILHQANLRMIESIMEQLGLPMEKTVTTVQDFGNTAAASIPVTLERAFAEGKLNPGDKVVLCGFGGGLSWGACLLEW